MVVYVEYVLIDNLIISTILLLLTFWSLKQRVHTGRIILSSLFGSITSFIFPIIYLPKILSFILKISVAIIMLIIAKKQKSIKNFLLQLLVFLAFTFVMGGACFAFVYMSNSEAVIAQGFNYFYSIPFPLIIGTVFVMSVIVAKLIKSFHKISNITKFVYTVGICVNSVMYQANGYLDSGNRIHDNGKPVIIISFALLSQMLNDENFTDVLVGNIQKLPFCNARYLSVGTIASKNNRILVFDVDYITVDTKNEVKTLSNVSVGVSFVKFKDYIEYDILLSPNIF